MAEALEKTGPTAKDILMKFNELHAVHLKVSLVEDAFHAKLGKLPIDNAIDFEALRAEIGPQPRLPRRKQPFWQS
ncbi:MAG: hypothetical protein ACJAVT_002419 [Yoonia sp.]|jgi:hypothetical protein